MFAVQVMLNLYYLLLIQIIDGSEVKTAAQNTSHKNVLYVRTCRAPQKW